MIQNEITPQSMFLYNWHDSSCLKYTAKTLHTIRYIKNKYKILIILKAKIVSNKSICYNTFINWIKDFDSLKFEQFVLTLYIITLERWNKKKTKKIHWKNVKKKIKLYNIQIKKNK